ncbi:hypothetical protein [Planctomicrobium sp. SH527]|uniref:hypothetical protein n=1 Tax=Planctomicrobium sp. SH527 TaxID=3448123 RepID=UPI003F5C07EB
MLNENCAIPAMMFAMLLVVQGCGSSVPDGPKRHHLKGVVNYEGKPVPFGMVTFDPDTSKGNSGPQGVASIKDGVFDTKLAGNRGTVGGATIISVVGTSHEVVTEGGEGRLLFGSYNFEKDLPKEDSTLDIEVPKKTSGKK